MVFVDFSQALRLPAGGGIQSLEDDVHGSCW